MDRAKQEFGRDRDSVTSIYITHLDSITQGMRGTAEKQFNLILAFLSIAVVIVGVVIPITQSNIQTSKGLLILSVIFLLTSIALASIITLWAIYKDRHDMDYEMEKTKSYFKKLLGLIANIYYQASRETLTTEAIDSYNAERPPLDKEFSQMPIDKLKWLRNTLYYSFLVTFYFGLTVFIIFTLINLGLSNKSKNQVNNGYKIYRQPGKL